MCYCHYWKTKKNCASDQNVVKPLCVDSIELVRLCCSFLSIKIWLKRPVCFEYKTRNFWPGPEWRGWPPFCLISFLLTAHARNTPPPWAKGKGERARVAGLAGWAWLVGWAGWAGGLGWLAGVGWVAGLGWCGLVAWVVAGFYGSGGMDGGWGLWE